MKIQLQNTITLFTLLAARCRSNCLFLLLSTTTIFHFLFLNIFAIFL